MFFSINHGGVPYSCSVSKYSLVAEWLIIRVVKSCETRNCINQKLGLRYIYRLMTDATTQQCNQTISAFATFSLRVVAT